MRKSIVQLYYMAIFVVLSILYVSYIQYSNTIVITSKNYIENRKAYYTSVSGIEQTISYLEQNIDRSSTNNGVLNEISYSAVIVEIDKTTQSGDTVNREVQITSTATGLGNVRKIVQADVLLSSTAPAEVVSLVNIK